MEYVKNRLCIAWPHPIHHIKIPKKNNCQQISAILLSSDATTSKWKSELTCELQDQLQNIHDKKMLSRICCINTPNDQPWVIF